MPRSSRLRPLRPTFSQPIIPPDWFGHMKKVESGPKEESMSKVIVVAKGGGGKSGGKGGGSPSNPNWPSRTGNPSGGDRGNNPPAKK